MKGSINKLNNKSCLVGQNKDRDKRSYEKDSFKI